MLFRSVLNITMEDKETVQTTDVIDMTQESVGGLVRHSPVGFVSPRAESSLEK